MTSHRAPDPESSPRRPGAQHGAAVWVERGRPDPFRAPGVPDRLVLVLHREGLHYVGKMSMWEYREIVVRRPNPDGGQSHDVCEMVVDASTSREVEIVVQMHQRPTAARLVAELVDVLRTKVGVLAGRDRTMPPGSPRPPRIDIRA